MVSARMCFYWPKMTIVLSSWTVNAAVSRGYLVTFNNLRTFILRAENVNDLTMEKLQDFLEKITPLKTLYLLLEGTFGRKIMETVLEVHGPAMRNLIWEERRSSRCNIRAPELQVSDNDLKVIAKHCPDLESLGISVRWPYLTSDAARYQRDMLSLPACPETRSQALIGVSSQFIAPLAGLKHLDTLNIPHLPDLSPKSDCYGNDTFFSGYAHALLRDLTAKSSPGRRLAFGATTFGNERLGVYNRKAHHLSDFLRLRIYSIRYPDSQLSGQQEPTLKLLAKGVADDAKGFCNHMELFDVYWLDGFTRELKDGME